jgi:hypothetical protein
MKTTAIAMAAIMSTGLANDWLRVVNKDMTDKGDVYEIENYEDNYTLDQLKQIVIDNNWNSVSTWWGHAYFKDFAYPITEGDLNAENGVNIYIYQGEEQDWRDNEFDIPDFIPRSGQCVPSEDVKDVLFDIFLEYTDDRDQTSLTYENYVALLSYYGAWGHEYFYAVWDKVMGNSDNGMDFIQFQHALAQATKQTFYEWNHRN